MSVSGISNQSSNIYKLLQAPQISKAVAQKNSTPTGQIAPATDSDGDGTAGGSNSAPGSLSGNLLNVHA